MSDKVADSKSVAEDLTVVDISEDMVPLVFEIDGVLHVVSIEADLLVGEAGEDE
jgi:hypothetical protein